MVRLKIERMARWIFADGCRESLRWLWQLFLLLPGLLKHCTEWHPRRMKFEGLMTALAMMACCVPVAAQEKGMWRAVSSTSKAITGDLAFSGEKIAINYLSFPIARIRSLQPAELSAAFDPVESAGGNGSLYRLNVPAATKFLHRNTLCGGEDTQWMATYVDGRSLRIAFFSGQTVPVFTLEAIGSSTDLCGTFAYTR